jgi:hypothetical protein
MSEFLLKLGSDLGHIYFLFVLALFVSNSIALHIKDEGGEGETRIIVGIVSGIIVVITAFLGGEILKLILYTFAVFGAFSFFGKPIEKVYMWLFFLLYDWIVKAWTYIKSLFKN